VDVKVAAARAERALERHAEPLVSFWAERPERWSSLLDVAWKDVIRNAAHDSICACSHDEVVDAVLHRYAEATRTALGVADHAIADAGRSMSTSGIHLLNPTSTDRREVVEVTVPSDADPVGPVQVIEEHPARQELHRTGAADAPLVVARELIFEHPEVASVRIENGPGAPGTDGPTLALHLLPRVEPDALTPADALGELGRRCSDEPDLQVVTVLHRSRPTRRVLAMSPEVPGFGWSRFEADHSVDTVRLPGGHIMENGLVRVEVEPDGTFSVDGIRGFGRLVDAGDAGDTYNWSPPEHDVVVDRAERVAIEHLEAGPLRARIAVEASYVLPEQVGRRDDGTWERTGEIHQLIRTTIELRAGESFVRVHSEVDHAARDHRLRVHFPLPERASGSRAECAFGVAERGLWAEGGPNEWGVPTFPSRRFVSSGGLTVAHEGLCEYELVGLDGPAEDPATTAGELALTLVRATGWLSRGPMRSRPLPAGPELPLEGAQVRKQLSLRYAICTDPNIDPYEVADRAWSPLVVVESDGGGHRPGTGRHLSVRGVAVDAVIREGSALVVRGHEPEGKSGELVIEGRSGAVIDLRGREIEPFDGRLPLRPHQIVTVRLDGATIDP
jgi:mannosylglycerate hydrolase